MIDVTGWIEAGGLLVIFLIIFSESGMLVGFFFPGDTLLLSAGILAAAGKLHLSLVLLVVAVAAILGDNIGYQIGKYLGPRLFKKNSFVFRHDYIEKAEKFFDKYGSKTMMLAHFVPIVRTYAPVAAGAAKMPRGKFAMFDAIGDIGWTVAVTLFGYFVGSRIPSIDRYIEPVLVLIIVVSLLPAIVKFYLERRKFKSQAKSAAKSSPSADE